MAETIERVKPARLQPGDTIKLIAPAGVALMHRIEIVRERLEARGYHVILPDNLSRKTGYLAGPDQVRADEFTAAFANPEVDAVFPATGGFGTTRMMHLVDWDVVKANPKIFIGFSDITALHAALNQRAGLVTFHSPNPQWGLGSDDGMHPFAEKAFWRAIEGPRDGEAEGSYTIDPAENGPPLAEEPPAVLPKTLVGGTAEGVIVGGNLALVAALMGTPDELHMDGVILYLEDVNEPPYKVDRMLATLKAAGKLDRLAGVLLGRFTKGEPDEKDNHTIDDVFVDYFTDAPYPVLAHFPAGHVTDNATLPLNVPARLDADAQTVTLLEEPTAAR
ncbi:MAG: LD-carboxypeptidase [Planctomycetota bacterium]